MAQQTRIDVVVRYWLRFIERFPDLPSLAAATGDEVAALWSGLGYYRRARMLREGAGDVMARFGGSIPRTVDELLTIAGIGRYTAGAIASIAFGRRAPVVDGNVSRVLARLEGVERPWERAEALVEACRSPRNFNQGLMEIGAVICRPRNPDCMHCPLRVECVAFATDRIHELPSRKEAEAAQPMRIALYLVRDSRGRILLRRERGALMNALFHLPHGDNSLLAGEPVAVEVGSRIGTFRHTITSRRVEFELFEASLRRERKGDAIRDADGEEYLWIEPAKLDRVPHPSYVAKALRLARNRRHPAGVGPIE